MRSTTINASKNLPEVRWDIRGARSRRAYEPERPGEVFIRSEAAVDVFGRPELTAA